MEASNFKRKTKKKRGPKPKAKKIEGTQDATFG